MIRLTVHTLPQLSIEQLIGLQDSLTEMSKNLPFLKPGIGEHLQLIRAALENKVPTEHQNQINDIMKEVEQNAMQKEVERQRKEMEEMKLKQYAEIERQHEAEKRFDRIIAIFVVVAVVISTIAFILI